MQKDNRDLLEVLKLELQFLKEGGYGRRARWRPPLIFEDSPSCMNNSNYERVPCRECVLMELVPAESCWEKVPCRHIPLNAKGETIDHFYRYGTPEELEGAVVNWLQETIERLEEERRRADSDAQHTGSRITKNGI